MVRLSVGFRTDVRKSASVGADSGENVTEACAIQPSQVPVRQLGLYWALRSNAKHPQYFILTFIIP